jgi:hypothetical protein
MAAINFHDTPGWAAAGLLTLLVLFAVIRKDPQLVFLLLLFCPGLLIAYKYGVTKQPRFLYTYIILLLLFLAGQTKTLARQALVVSLMTLFLYFMNLTIDFHDSKSFRFGALAQLNEADQLLHPLDLRTSPGHLFFHKRYENKLLNDSASLLQPLRLDEQTLTMVGNSPVDTYPWEISFIPANGLNWRPRPVFGSYFTYTPWLDRRNEAFFLSDRSPEFILWDLERTDPPMSIDGRYLLNDEPLTVIQILSRYTLVRQADNALLFQKRRAPIFSGPVIVSTSGPIVWNSGFDVPGHGRGILRARIQFTRTFLGKLRRTFYSALLKNNIDKRTPEE